MNANQQASYWVKHLNLQPHPEGGFYREVYRCPQTAPLAALPAGFSGARNFCTSIFYLIEAGDFSAFHRIKSDETWHFYAGGPLEVIMLLESGLSTVTLGQEVALGHHLQYTVPAHTWFASRPAVGTSFSLVGCTVSPGFDFSDFELAKRKDLVDQFPQVAEKIATLTRQ